jgi:hypothetical protein
MKQDSCFRFVLVIAFAPLASPVAAQRHYPPISARTLTSGSIQITVTGAFTMNAMVALNAQGGFGDGEMTWLPFGASGGTAPNALITFTDMGEVGITVAQGTLQAVGGIGGNEKPWCSGKVDVKPKLITGEYTCLGISSHDQATDRMGKVNVTVKFTAGS